MTLTNSFKPLRSLKVLSTLQTMFYSLFYYSPQLLKGVRTNIFFFLKDDICFRYFTALKEDGQQSQTNLKYLLLKFVVIWRNWGSDLAPIEAWKETNSYSIPWYFGWIISFQWKIYFSGWWHKTFCTVDILIKFDYPGSFTSLFIFINYDRKRNCNRSHEPLGDIRGLFAYADKHNQNSDEKT